MNTKPHRQFTPEQKAASLRIVVYPTSPLLEARDGTDQKRPAQLNQQPRSTKSKTLTAL